MQPSIEIANPTAPVIQIYIAGRSMIRLYKGEKCVGFSDSYKFAQIRADELAKAKPKREVH